MDRRDRLASLSGLLDHLGALLKKSREYVPLEEQTHFERQIAEGVGRLVAELGESTKAWCHEGWSTIEPEWQQLHTRTEEWERKVRIRALEHPTSQADCRANLFWVAERGIKNDIPLLRRLKKNPPDNVPDDFLRLLDVVIQRLHDRTHSSDASPAAVLQQGEQAYQLHKDAWERQYAGHYIAIAEGKVIAAETQKTKLLENIVAKQREGGPFYTCIIHVDSSLLPNR